MSAHKKRIDKLEVLIPLYTRKSWGISTGKFEDILGVYKQTARKFLVELKKQGLVTETGTSSNPLRPMSHAENPKVVSNLNNWYISDAGIKICKDIEKTVLDDDDMCLALLAINFGIECEIGARECSYLIDNGVIIPVGEAEFEMTDFGCDIANDDRWAIFGEQMGDTLIPIALEDSLTTEEMKEWCENEYMFNALHLIGLIEETEGGQWSITKWGLKYIIEEWLENIFEMNDKDSCSREEYYEDYLKLKEKLNRLTGKGQGQPAVQTESRGQPVDIPDDIQKMLNLLNTKDAFTDPHIENLMKIYEGECVRFIDFENVNPTLYGFCLNAHRLRAQGYADFEVTLIQDDWDIANDNWDVDTYEVENDAVVTLTEKGREWVKEYKKFLRAFVASTEDKTEPSEQAGSQGQSVEKLKIKDMDFDSLLYVVKNSLIEYGYLEDDSDMIRYVISTGLKDVSNEEYTLSLTLPFPISENKGGFRTFNFNFE